MQELGEVPAKEVKEPAQERHLMDAPVLHSRQKEWQTAQLATVESGK